MINPIVSGISSALQTLDQLLGAPLPANGRGGADAFSTGQTLPAGATSAAPPSTAPGQFAPAALGFLTSLQDEGSHIWSTAKGHIGHDLTDLASIVGQLQQALNGSSSTSSAQATSLASLPAGVQSVLTSSAFAQALNELGTALQGFAAFGDHLHPGASPSALAGTSSTAGPTSA